MASNSAWKPLLTTRKNAPPSLSGLKRMNRPKCHFDLARRACQETCSWTAKMAATH